MIGLIYKLFTRSFIVLLISMLSVNYLPEKLFDDYPFQPKSVDTNHLNSIVLEWNSKLSHDVLDYVLLNQIRGPESLAFNKAGLLYTGLADGRIVEIDPSNKMRQREVTRFNKKSTKCIPGQVLHSDECGRFLQLRFHQDTLYAIEPNNGLYKIDTVRGEIKNVGPKAISATNLYNGFAFDPVEPNIVYITTSTTKWSLSRIMWSFLEMSNDSQILALDTSTGKRVVLLSNLYMANGIDVDQKRDQIIFSETGISRIGSLSLSEARAAFKSAQDGSKVATLKSKVFIPVVPGNPDNIIIKDDIAYIGLPFIKENGKELVDHLSDKPAVRLALGRSVYGAAKLIEYFCKNVYNHPILENVYLTLKSGRIFYYLRTNTKSGLITVNLATGAQRFLGSDKFAFLSEAHPDNLGNLYLGSFDNSFIVKIKNPTK